MHGLDNRAVKKDRREVDMEQRNPMLVASGTHQRHRGDCSYSTASRKRILLVSTAASGHQVVSTSL